MVRGMLKRTSGVLGRQDGFALVTAILLLFVAMILGQMVVDFADMEIMLSGALQRYEDSINTPEGGAGAEASAVGTRQTIPRNSNTHSYSVANPLVQIQVLPPDNSGTDPLYDPGNDLTLSGPVTVTTTTSPELWPMAGHPE
jgi:hypothetical protein